MEPRPPNVRPRHPLDRTPQPPTSPLPQPTTAPLPGRPAPAEPRPAEAPGGGMRRPEPPRYGPDPYALPPPATPEGGYPPRPLSERVPRRGGARRAALRGIVVLVVAVAALGAFAAVLGRDALPGDLFGGDDDGTRTAAQTPLAGAAAAQTPATTATAPPVATTPAPATTPTPEAEPTAEATAAPTAPARRPTSTPAPAGAGQGIGDLRDLLPTAEEIPGGLTQVGEGERNAQDVALSFGEGAAAEAAVRLEEWGWSQNVYREFEIAQAEADPAAVTVVNVSLHRFGSAEAAAEALGYFSDGAAAGGLQDTAIEQIGDGARALVGGDAGTNLVALYVQRDAALIRVGTFSPAGDALPMAIEVARLVAAK